MIPKYVYINITEDHLKKYDFVKYSRWSIYCVVEQQLLDVAQFTISMSLDKKIRKNKLVAGKYRIRIDSVWVK